jgi:hypothetical protein
MVKAKQRLKVIGQVLGAGEVALVAGLIQTEGALEVEAIEEALEVEMVRTEEVMEVEANLTRVDLEVEVVQTEGALEVEGTEAALVVEAEEGEIKMVVGVTTVLLKIVPLAGRMGQTIAVEDGKIMVVEAVGTKEVTIRANIIAEMLVVVEQAIELVVGAAKIQTGTSQEWPKMVVVMTLLVVGTRELVQILMLPGVKETAGSHQILLVGTGIQTKKLKILMIKEVAGTKDPVLVFQVMAGGTKELVQEMQGQLEVMGSPGINLVLPAEANHLAGVNQWR